MFDNIIVGAGISGCVIAERLASQKGKRVLIVEQRNHIGGNCYDHMDEFGVLIHKYGPHIFHTDNNRVFEYLSKFTEWHEYQHEVLACIDGKKVPIPFNLNSLYALFTPSMAQKLEMKLIEQYGYNVKIPILKLRQTSDEDLRALSDYIYEKVFVNYSAKQWGCKPEEIMPEVTARVPVYISKDNRYFQDTYQAIPKFGYTKMMEQMTSCGNISKLLNCNCKDVLEIDLNSKQIKFMGTPFAGRVVFTGRIDELFDYCLGELAYRSLRFDFENCRQEFFQERAVENYPNNYDFTRITEFKHISGQTIGSTTIAREFPQAYDRHDPKVNIPYYPVFTEASQEKYEAYKNMLSGFQQIIPIGRLAEYKYYDMDDIVEQALDVFKTEFGQS